MHPLADAMPHFPEPGLTRSKIDIVMIVKEATRDRQELSEFKKIRDQAFTHLKEVVDLIRKCGQYVLRLQE
jgi:hypothetical protein